MLNWITAALAALLGGAPAPLTAEEIDELDAYRDGVKDAIANGTFSPPDPDRKGFIF